MKICIIGNSHLAALKLAIRDGLYQNDGLEIVFWGLHANRYGGIKYENGRLIGPDRDIVLLVSDGKYETVAPDDFDALVFHGPAVNYTLLLQSVRRHSADLRSYSVAFLRDGVAEYLDKRLTCELIRQIRLTYKGRLLVSPLPMISEQSRALNAQGVESAECALLDDILHGYFEQLGAEYIQQPEVTIVHNIYTAKEYCIDSVRLVAELNVKHPEDDCRHMNKLYGREVLRAIAEKLGC